MLISGGPVNAAVMLLNTKMLDVHVVDSGSPRSVATPPVLSFSEALHSAIFHGAGIDVYSKFAHLRRMHDYYADAKFSGDELLCVADDIDHLLQMISSHPDVHTALTHFRRVCVEAHDNKKAVFLICD